MSDQLKFEKDTTDSQKNVTLELATTSKICYDQLA